MKRALAIVCTLMMLLSLAACGKSSASSKDVAGSYKFVSMESGGESMTRDDFISMGMSEEDMDSMFVLEMKEDGSFSLSSNGDKEEGTYKDGKMTVDGQDVSFDYSGGKLSMESDGVKMVFEKK